MTEQSQDIPLEDQHQPSDNELKAVVTLARQQWQLERKVADLERQLKEAVQQLRDLAERELPNLMVEVGMKQLTLQNGVALKLDTEVYASISKAAAEQAHSWLEEHGHADLITREFKIRFNREDEKWADKFQRDLNRRKRPLNAQLRRAVHPQTLNAWVRETLLAGAVIPEELFGVFRKRVAKLTMPKTEVVS